MNMNARLIPITYLVIAITAFHARADVRLPHIFGNNMVLQCDKTVPIWGWATAGERVSIRLGDIECKATADRQGNWVVKLPAQKAGGPYLLDVSGKNRITLNNVLIGEVWLCSGQSNMEMALSSCNDAQREVADANYPEIRTFLVGHVTDGEPQSDCTGEWNECRPETAGSLSGAAYFFGRDIHLAMKVPVGLIQSTWGGTRIEPWTPREGFAQVSELKDISNLITKANKEYQLSLAPKLDDIETWIRASKLALHAGTSVPARPQWPKHPLDADPLNPIAPTCLYNAMIHPLAPFAIRGVIWYQGESNVGDTDYTEKMRALIGGWRTVWNDHDIPFYYVQIAPFFGYPDNALPLFWEAQTAALSIPKTGIAATLDTVHIDPNKQDVNDIHPKDKEDVGKRLARWALANTYRRVDVTCSGPIYDAMQVEGNRIRISFSYTGNGLKSRDDQPLSWFVVSGDDRKFVQAQAKIEGNTVVVWSDQVTAPFAVRFAWDKVAQPNLVNSEGLPALPFRTDRW